MSLWSDLWMGGGTLSQDEYKNTFSPTSTADPFANFIDPYGGGSLTTQNYQGWGQNAPSFKPWEPDTEFGNFVDPYGTADLTADNFGSWSSPDLEYGTADDAIFNFGSPFDWGSKANDYSSGSSLWGSAFSKPWLFDAGNDAFGEAFIPPDDEFAATTFPYQEQSYENPSFAALVAGGPKAYEPAETGFPRWQSDVVEAPDLGKLWERGWPSQALPDYYREDYYGTLIQRDRLTPDQLREAIDTRTPTLGEYFDLARWDYDRWQKQLEQQRALQEHEQLTPYPDLGENIGTLSGTFSGGYTREEAAALPDEELARRARALQGFREDWQRQEQEGLTALEAGGLLANLPGIAVEQGLGQLPEEVAGVPNPLANDVVGQFAGGFANIAVGAMLGGAPGAFLGAMAPAFRADESGELPWDQMDWKEKVFALGSAALNAKLLTSGAAIERAIGGNTAVGMTTAGVGINAAVPVITGAAQVALTEQRMNDPEFWKDIAMEAAIWGTVRGVAGISPIIREETALDIPLPFKKRLQTGEEIPDFSAPVGQIDGLPAFEGTTRVSRRELSTFKEGLDWLRSDEARSPVVKDVTPEDVPASVVLIARLAEEFRGEKPPMAVTAIERVINEVPEAVGTIAPLAKIAVDHLDTIPGISARLPEEGGGMLPVPRGTIRPNRMEALDNLEQAANAVLEDAKLFLPMQARGREINNQQRVVIDTVGKAPYDENHPFDYVWTDDRDGNIHINPRGAIGDAKVIEGELAPPREIAVVAAALVRAGTMFEYGRSRSTTPNAGATLSYEVDFVHEVLIGRAPDQLDMLIPHLEDLISTGIVPSPPRAAPWREPNAIEISQQPRFGNMLVQGAEKLPYAQDFGAVIRRGFWDAQEQLGDVLQRAGIKHEINFGGLSGEKGRLAFFVAPGQPYGGPTGSVYFVPHEMAKGVALYRNLDGEDVPKALGLIAANTTLHEIAHSVEPFGDHTAAFNRALGIIMSLGADGIVELAENFEAGFRSLAPNALRELLNDAARVARAERAPTFAKYLGKLSESIPTERPDVWPVREPVRGPEAGVPVEGDTGVLPEGGPERRLEPRGPRTLLREDQGGGEPGGPELRRGDGERPVEPERGEGVQSAPRDDLVREPREGDTAGRGTEDVNLPEPIRERARDREQKREEQRKSYRGTWANDTGTASTQWAFTLFGSAAAGLYGYNSTDGTADERAIRASIWALGGLMAMRGFDRSGVWLLNRYLRGKPVRIPDAADSWQIAMTKAEFEGLLDIVGQFAEHPEGRQQELALLAKLAGLNAERLKNQKTIIEGINAPLERFRQQLKDVFAPSKEMKNLQDGQGLIIGHYDMMADAAERSLKEVFDLAEGFLPDYESKVAFLLAFESPTRYAYSLESEPLRYIAMRLSQTFHEFGSLLADKGLLSSDVLGNPEVWYSNEFNYVTRMYDILTPEEKAFVVAGPKFTKSDIEKNRKYKTLGESILAGNVPRDVNPVELAIRYVNTVTSRIAAIDLQEWVTHVAEQPQTLFIPKSRWDEMRYSQQTVLDIANYIEVDSSLFRNRVDPADITFANELAEGINLRMRDVKRYQRLEGHYGRRAREAANRAYDTAERMERIENRLSDTALKLEERTQLRDSLLAELEAHGRATLDELTKAAGARGRLGKESQLASLRFNRAKQDLEKALEKVDNIRKDLSPEFATGDDVVLSQAKEDILRAADDAAQVAAEERVPEISSAIEKAAEEFERKYSAAEEYKVAKEAEEAALESIRKELSTREKAERLGLHDLDMKAANLEGQIRQLDYITQRFTKLSVGSEAKAAQWASLREHVVEEIENLRAKLKELNERRAANRETLLVRKDIAPLFRWTERSALRSTDKGKQFLRGHAKWKQTLMSGAIDLYMIGAHFLTHAGTLMPAGGPGRRWDGLKALGAAARGATLEALHPYGNQKWHWENEPWINFFVEGRMGFQRSHGEMLGGKSDETLLGWIPILGELYEKGVGMMDRAQFAGWTSVLKVEDAKRFWFASMKDALERANIDDRVLFMDVDERLKSGNKRYGDGQRGYFNAVMDAMKKAGVSEADIHEARVKVGRHMDGLYGGKNMKLSGWSATAQDLLALSFFAPNWLLTRVDLFGRAFRDISLTPVQFGESVIGMAAKVGGKDYKRRTAHPFDLTTQSGKQWAIGTIMVGTAALVLSAVAFSSLQQTMKKGELSGPDWDYVKKTLKLAFTDPTHFLEIRDPWTGQYYTPFTWQKDFVRFSLAAYYVLMGDKDKAWETIGSYGKARLGPLPRTIYNLAFDQNFAGRDITRGEGKLEWVKDQVVNFLLENQPQMFTETEKSVPVKDGKTLGEIWGLGYTNPLFAIFNMLGLGRGRTQTPLDKAWVEDLRAGKVPEEFNNYSLADPLTKAEFLERHPEVKEYLRAGLPAGYIEVSDEAKANINARAEMAVKGEDQNGKVYKFAQFREDIRQINATLRGAGEGAQFKDRKPETKEEKLLFDYYKIFDEATVNGVLDGDLYNEKFAEFAKDKTNEDLDYVFQRTQVGDHYALQQYARAIRELKEIKAFDMPRYDPARLRSGKSEEELLDFVAKAKVELRLSGSDEAGMNAVSRYIYDLNGLSTKNKPPTDVANFIADVRMVMGKPNNPEYLKLKEEHPGLFAWLEQDLTYKEIMKEMEKEPEDIRNVVIFGK